MVESISMKQQLHSFTVHLQANPSTSSNSPLLVFNLTNGIDVDETKRKIDEYVLENRKSIDQNRRKMVRCQKLTEKLYI